MRNELLYTVGGGAPDGQIHFVASNNFSNVDFFQNITRENPSYDFSNLEVYINGELTTQVANSISASANDDVVIKATKGVYPWFGHYTSSSNSYSINYIKSIEEPLPLMYQANGDPITDFKYCFSACSSLTSIPAGLFDNNPQVTSFDYCFSACFSLTSIPAGLFDNNPQVTIFSYCFYSCDGLTNIPSDLFDKNINVTDFSYCFAYCSSLIVNVQIGSTASSVDVAFFALDTKSKGTVYCRAGSAAYTAFVELSDDANVNVLTY